MSSLLLRGMDVLAAGQHYDLGLQEAVKRGVAHAKSGKYDDAHASYR